MDDCHIQIKRGSTFSAAIRLTTENNEAKDLTGWSYSSDLKLKAGRDPLLSFSINDDDGSNGVLVLTAPPEETAVLPPNRSLELDLKLTDPLGNIHYTETVIVKIQKHITD
jgi:hypothetical protein